MGFGGVVGEAVVLKARLTKIVVLEFQRLRFHLDQFKPLLEMKAKCRQGDRPQMETLHFKTTEAAFEYAKIYFSKAKPSLGASYIGIVRHVDMSNPLKVYAVEVLCSVRKLLKTETSLTVAAVSHPDLKVEVSKNDLVIVGLDDLSKKLPSGFVLHKLLPEMDVKSGTFKIKGDIKKFKIFVDDNFHYTNEDERYLFGEYDNLDDAIEACKKIVDESISDLMKDCNLSELLEKYQSFGDDPFVYGGEFSAWDYAKEKIDALVLQKRSLDQVDNLWKYGIDHTYGLLLRESEILEQPGFIYFSQTNRQNLCIAWNIDLKVWEVNVNRVELDGLSFSTVKRFEEVVFCEDEDFDNYRKKQYLNEFLLHGKKSGQMKTLTASLDWGSKIEFSVDSTTWNEMLIGNWVGIERGFCKYFENENSEGRFIPFGLMCDKWDLKIEYIFGDYEDFGQKDLPLKSLGNYYS